MGVFKLGELHNLSAMLCLSIKKLSPENRPPAKIMSYFNQALGMTIQSYENKVSGIDLLTKLFNENKINHLFVKGAAIRSYYPVAEVRTSGDTDVIVESKNLNKAADILVENGFTLSQRTDIQNVLFYKGEEFEIKNYIDGVNKKCEEFFANPFNGMTENIGENAYSLLPTYHLAYVISHLLRHLTTGGVGIRQLIDVDVLLRSGKTDINKLFDIARELGVEKSFKVVISLSKEYFDTPVDIDFKVNAELKNSLEKVILTGGVFGFAISDNGTSRLIRSLNTSKKQGVLVSLRAFLSMIFVDKEYLYRVYNYSDRHHFLLPLAFFNRLFDAVFKRGKSNAKAISNIFNNKETAIMINDIINELEIEM